MRVTGPTAPTVGTTSPAGAKALDTTQLFELALGQGAGTQTRQLSTLTGTATLSGLDAILALQEVARDIGSRKRAIRRGHDMLDRLDDIKVGLLSGKVDTGTLDRIVDLLSQREPSGDERIDGVLDEIELRAKVEMAKLGHFPE